MIIDLTGLRNYCKNNFISFLFVLFSLFQFSSIYSQAKLELNIKDSSGLPIPYASVVWGKNLGLVSSLAGSLQIPDKSKIDSIIITAIGYRQKVVGIKEVSNIDKLVIVLINEDIVLPEFILAKYRLESEYGCTKKDYHHSHIKNNICNNLQGALLISGYDYPAICKNISVFINKNSSTNIPYRLLIYDVTSAGLPGKNITPDDFIVSDYKRNSWNTYNFDSMQIQLPKAGFFIAIEWLCTDIKSTNGLCIEQSGKLDGALSFYKSGNGDWYQMRAYPYDKFTNLMLKTKIATIK